MNRGSAFVFRAVRFRWYGFNEAPIHESGKSVMQRSKTENGGLLQ